ncbi:MAG: potassium channel protein [Bacteroidales bacterium]|nr:potassium channel protein [Bacteroidales bacterium]
MHNHTNISRLLYAAVSLILVMIIGVVGFMYIEGDTFVNSAFMTVITFSTVGYSLLHELSDSGKIFTIFLIVLSLGVYAYSISIITTYFVEGNVAKIIRGRTFKRNKKMKDHTIVCGYGRIGKQVTEELLAYNRPFLVIDQRAEVIDSCTNNKVVFLEGDATNDDVLKKAGIENASALISALPLDADNLYVSLSAKALNTKITVISRGTDESAEKKLHMAGVNHVILPEKVGGARMAKLVTSKNLVEFLDHLTYSGESLTNLEEIDYMELPDEYHNKTILEIGIRKKSGANIVGFKTSNGEFIINPTPDVKIEIGSKLFVLGTPEQLKSLRK